LRLQSYDIMPDVRSIVVGDIDGDHSLDLVVVGDGVSILLGNGDGTFRTPSYDRSDTGMHSVALGNFNGDGPPDLITAESETSGRITIYG
jgi:hypothetical protein